MLRFLCLLAAMGASWVVANLFASILVFVQFATSPLDEYWEPWVFHEMKQLTETLLTWIIGLLLWLCSYIYMYVPISALIEISIFSPALHSAFVDSKVEYSYYEISLARTTATSPAHDSSQDQSPCAPQLRIPLLDTIKAEKVETGFTRDLSEQRPQTNASLLKPQTKASLLKPQTNFINEAPSILSRKRPIPRLSFESPRFSSRLDEDTTLDDDGVATLLQRLGTNMPILEQADVSTSTPSRTLFRQTDKNGTDLELDRMAIKKESSEESLAWPLPASQPLSTQRPSWQSDIDREPLRSYPWALLEPSMSPRSEVRSPIPTTPSTDIPPSCNTATNQNRTPSQFGQKGVKDTSKIPRLSTANIATGKRYYSLKNPPWTPEG